MITNHIEETGSVSIFLLRFAYLRAQLKCDIGDIATLLGMSSSYVAQICFDTSSLKFLTQEHPEYGIKEFSRIEPTPTFIEQIASALGVAQTWLEGENVDFYGNPMLSQLDDALKITGIQLEEIRSKFKLVVGRL